MSTPQRPVQQLTRHSGRLVLDDSLPMRVDIARQWWEGAEAWDSTHPVRLNLNHNMLSLTVRDAEYLHAELGRVLALMGRGPTGLW